MLSTTVTARMSEFKKQQGRLVFESLGKTPSEAINEFYDYAIEKKELPWKEENRPHRKISQEEYKKAVEFIRSLQIDFDDGTTGPIDVKAWKRKRLEEKGLM